MKTCAICGGGISEVRNEAYDYSVCGLPVLLFGLTQHRCDACREIFVNIPEVDKLHLLLSERLICKKDRLIGDEIKFLRKELRLRSIDFAKIIGITPAYLSRLESGKGKTSEMLDKFIKLVYITEQSELHQQVLHRDMLTTLKKVSTEPVLKERKPFELNPTDWLKAPDQLFCAI